MHAGGDVQSIVAKVVLGVDHLPLVIGEQRAAVELAFAARQPQGGIHHVKVVIQQRKAQILRPDAVAPVLVHAQRGPGSQPGFQIAVERREAAVKADHQDQILTCGQRHQPLGIGKALRQRFIDADMHTGV